MKSHPTKSHLTKTFAKNFVTRLMDTLFMKGKMDLIDQFYTKDVVLHYCEETFHFEEIHRRIFAIKTTTLKFHATVEDLIVIDDLIIFRSKQTWKNKKNKAWNECIVFAVYRMRAQKICELWLLMDESTKSYAEINRNFAEEMQSFELCLKDKNTFLKRLCVALQFHGNIKLSKIEKECLYYYFHGYSAKETAVKMDLSYRTIQTYLSQIKERFDCKTKLALRKKIFF